MANTSSKPPPPLSPGDDVGNDNQEPALIDQLCRAALTKRERSQQARAKIALDPSLNFERRARVIEEILLAPSKPSSKRAGWPKMLAMLPLCFSMLVVVGIASRSKNFQRNKKPPPAAQSEAKVPSQTNPEIDSRLTPDVRPAMPSIKEATPPQLSAQGQAKGKAAPQPDHPELSPTPPKAAIRP